MLYYHNAYLLYQFLLINRLTGLLIDCLIVISIKTKESKTNETGKE